MEQFKKYRLPLLFCVLLVLAAIVAGIAVNLFVGVRSANDHISVGQRYLNELNYSEAILEFSNAVEMNPGSREARQGLATAYAATGNYRFAEDVLQDVQDPFQPDEGISASLLDIYQQADNYGQAINMSNQLIELTDSEDYYTLREELMRTWHKDTRAWAAGTDQELAIQNGSVVSRGSNTLGQLGTENGLGQADYRQEEFASAQFPGTPKSVYCAGRTSYVLDTNGNLWAAGENRWGQMGESYATTLPSGGWTQLTDTGDVVAAAGVAGQMLVRNSDCSLWQAGSGTGQTLTRVNQLGAVMKIGASNNVAYVLTADGKLYESNSYGAGWQRLSGNVANFEPCSSGCVWVTEDGGIGSEFGISLPANWTVQQDGSAQPDVEVSAVASDGNNLVVHCADDTLYLVSGGTVAPLDKNGAVSCLYVINDQIVVELEDGSRMVLQDGKLQQAAL